MFNQNPDILRGRDEIADYLGITPRTLDNWRKKAKGTEQPMPILKPGGGEIQASKAKLEEWRLKQMA
jgi:hypothetical protein